ncbi:MAG: HD domain-containing protein [Fimbriimonadales bacterium]|nr:HD domain-containing protein [Fimbriimonadales bacterium]
MARKMGGWVLAWTPSRSWESWAQVGRCLALLSVVVLTIATLAVLLPAALGFFCWFAAGWLAGLPWLRQRWTMEAVWPAVAIGLGVALVAGFWAGGFVWPLSLLLTFAAALGWSAEWSRRREELDDRLCEDLGQLLRAAHPYTHGHSQRVAKLAVQLGERLGVSRAGLRRLRRAGLLHDIGKVALLRRVLDKPGSLTEEERGEIRLHPRIGSRVAALAPPFREVAEIILHHHERPDGRGYPDGICGAELSQLCRILTVADAFDAMTGGPAGSERCYRSSVSRDEALGELHRHSDTQFDARVVRALTEVLDAGR